MNQIFTPEEMNELSLMEKLETVLSYLDTPIARRRIGNAELSAVITMLHDELKKENESDKLQQIASNPKDYF